MDESGSANTFRPRFRNPAHLFSWMGNPERVDPDIPPSPPVHCPRCSAILPTSTSLRRLRVCPSCGFHLRMPARDRIAVLVDEGTFHERDRDLTSNDPLRFHDARSYQARLAHQQSYHQHRDALVAGTARMGGMAVTVAVLDFTFMGGSMGLVVGEKLASEAEACIEAQRPLVTIVASGGARMQEGMFALWQMARTAAAIRRLHTAGIPYISVLTDPTTGGAFASFASLGDIILAEPDALIGFAGPRVAEAMMGTPLPEGSHRAEYLLAHGHIDAIVPRVAQRQTILTILGIWHGVRGRDDRAVQPESSWRADPERSLPEPWTLTREVRNRQRPSSRAYIDRIVADFLPLAGDRVSGDDPAIIAGTGRITGLPVLVIGLDRGHDLHPDAAPLQPRPEGFRKAHRLMTLAARWRLPVVTLIDTPGAWPGIESEQGGLAAAIARTFALLPELPTATISVVIGEGGSGGALALAVADRMLMQERAVFSVIAPEGAAAILYHDPARAPELATSLRITARDLQAFGMVDDIVSEPPAGAATNPDLAASLVEQAISAHLHELRRDDVRHLGRHRYARVRHLGDDYITRPSRTRRVTRWLKDRICNRRRSPGSPQLPSGTS